VFHEVAHAALLLEMNPRHVAIFDTLPDLDNEKFTMPDAIIPTCQSFPLKESLIPIRRLDVQEVEKHVQDNFLIYPQRT
jgi:hypothetical protein